MRTTTEAIHDHLVKRLADATDADIEENYSEDVILLTGSGEFRGHRGVPMAADELANLVGSGTFTYTQTLVSGDYAFLEWTADGENEVCDGADSFAVKDGRIVMQTIHYSPRAVQPR